MDDAGKPRAQLIQELAALRAQVASLGDRLPDGEPAGDWHYRRILDHVRAIVVETDAEGRLTFVSPSTSEILGMSPEQLLATQGPEWLHPDDRKNVTELIEKLVSSGEPARTRVRANHGDGGWRWLEVVFDAYDDDEGGLRTVAVARDVTDEHAARDALHTSESRYRALAENASDLIVEINQERRFEYVSTSCWSVLGRDAEELSISGLACARSEDPERVLDFANVMTGPGADDGRPITVRVERGDGSPCWLECKGRAYLDPGGRRHTVVIARDVTDRVDRQVEISRRNRRYQLIAEASQEWLTESDAEGRLLYVSPHISSLIGRSPEELVGTTPIVFLHPDDLEKRVEEDLEAARTGQPVQTDPYRVQHADGSWRWVRSRGITYDGPDGEPVLLRVTYDVTAEIEGEQERRGLESRMEQAQKLESLGVMAGGIAHDFNNLLTPILGDTSLALLDLPPDSPVRNRLQKVQKAAHRAASLTNQMLAYAGEEPLHVEVLDVSRLVDEMAQLLETAASQEANLTYELEEGLPLVEADPARLSQVVMNLILNASEAVTGREGRIVLRTGATDLEREQLGRLLLGEQCAPGAYAYLEVEDNGTGMDPDTLRRIFDPFFTTKFTGRGLGLATVLGIVSSHKGTLELESEPGRGTRFRVYLPCTSRGMLTRRPEPEGIENWRTRGTVLVVDDEEGVRELCADTLARAGLTVISASNGREGIDLFEKHADEIRLVLLDRTMPTTSGEEAFEQIRRIRPDARVVLVSGYSQLRAEESFLGKGLDGFLQKPFLPTTLLEKVRGVLEG